MSKIKISGNASGTGVVTLTAPNTNTDRVITLPDGDISLGVGIDDNATSTAITIDSGENVGIGTNSPSRSLHITSNANTPSLRLSSGSTYTADYGPSIEFQNGSGELLAGVKGAFEQSSQGNYGVLTFSTRTSDALGIEEKMRIDSSGRVTMPNQPSFDAYVASSSATFVNEVIGFDTISTHNTGSHFSTSTHRFTAPVTGKYLFTYNVQKSGTANTETQFQKNGSKLSDTHVHHTASGNHASQSVVWYLAANDYVDVKVVSGTAYGDYTHFSGHLLG